MTQNDLATQHHQVLCHISSGIPVMVFQLQLLLQLTDIKYFSYNYS